MSLSDRFWLTLKAVDRKGMPRLAAAIASIVCRDREFSVDVDGDRINRQRQATFFDSNLAPARYDYLRAQMQENWFFEHVPGKDDIVVDIGAGVGDEAVIFSRLAKRVICIEAHPKTYRCLAKTIAANQLDNVTPVWAAITDRDGEVRLSDGPDHLSNMIVSDSGFAVPGRSLQSLCDELGIGEIGFLKMNIEGAETLAVKGFGAIKIRHLVISCHDFLERDEMRTKAAVEKFLRENGYIVTTRPDHPISYTRCNLYASHA